MGNIHDSMCQPCIAPHGQTRLLAVPNHASANFTNDADVQPDFVSTGMFIWQCVCPLISQALCVKKAQVVLFAGRGCLNGENVMMISS